MTVTAKSTMIIGSLKNGMMQINAGEKVEVVGETKKSYYVEKDGMVKIIPRERFTEN
jgi:FKBP-type peptidyl-prolyl cis-trans isomerase 2